MLRGAVALLFALAGVSSAWAQAYPARAVKVIVPFAVGGRGDIYGRFIAAAAGRPRPAPFRTVWRRLDGTDAAAKAAPDGPRCW
jgi:tripartite-type tricarboxylate transporter receptor subunit TctC